MTMNIKEVTLYQSGVGFFSANCPEKEFILPINENDINDVLKSLSVNGLSSVRFNSAEEIQNIINKLGIDLESEGTLLSLCGHLIGTKIKIKTDQEYEGIVIGLDEIDDDSKEGLKTNNEILVLKIQDEIRNFSLKDIRDIEILDQIILKDLNSYLEFLANKRKAGVINLHVDAKANTWATWVMPTSSWRLSYRIFYNKEKKKLDLVGISVVDNTTSTDWENIILRLVTGKPVSFRYDLFNPLMIDRPEVARDVKGVAPIISEVGGLFEDFDGQPVDIADRYMAEESAPMAPPPPPSAAPKAFEKMAMGSGARALAKPIATLDDVKPVIEAIAQDFGSAVAYTVNYPITINRSQSAMIPIFSEERPVELCVILREDRLNDAMDAIKFKTPIDLEKGAATVYMDGQYAGESMIITGTEFIAYRLNQEISAMKDVSTTSKIESVNLEGIYLSIKHSSVREYVFKFINRAKEPLNTILEVSKVYNYHPIGKPDAETKNYYQYFLNLKPGNSVTKIEFKSETMDYKQLSDLSESQIETYVRDELLSNADSRKIKKILEIARELRQKENDQNTMQKEIEEQFRNQQRIRENILVIRDDKTLLEEYLTKLTESENRIILLKEKISLIKKEIEELRKKYDSVV
ncbi:MAG: hypothetical protein ACFFDW_13550 [Candidatus Thorarchaeota archaeon]